MTCTIQVAFFRLEASRYVPHVPDERGILRSVALPGFWIDVAWLWPREQFIAVAAALRQIAESAQAK